MVTLASLGGNVLTERPEGVGLREWKTNGTTIYPGAVVTMAGQTSPDCAPVDATTETPYGIAVENTDVNETNPDTAFGDGEWIAVAPCGSGMVCRVLAVTSRGAILPGNWVHHAGDRMIESVYSMTSDSLTTQMTDWNALIGRAVEYDADVAAWDYVEVRLCQ